MGVSLTMMMLVRHIPMHHEMLLVVSVRVDVDRFMIAVRHMRPDGAAEGVDFCFILYMSRFSWRNRE